MLDLVDILGMYAPYLIQVTHIESGNMHLSCKLVLKVPYGITFDPNNLPFEGTMDGDVIEYIIVEEETNGKVVISYEYSCGNS